MGFFFQTSFRTSKLLPAEQGGRAKQRISSLANITSVLALLPADLGNRGDVVSVKKHVGRNKLLPQGLAVYASPENKKMFEEEKKVSRCERAAPSPARAVLSRPHLEIRIQSVGFSVGWSSSPSTTFVVETTFVVSWGEICLIAGEIRSRDLAEL